MQWRDSLIEFVAGCDSRRLAWEALPTAAQRRAAPRPWFRTDQQGNCVRGEDGEPLPAQPGGLLPFFVSAPDPPGGQRRAQPPLIFVDYKGFLHVNGDVHPYVHLNANGLR